MCIDRKYRKMTKEMLFSECTNRQELGEGVVSSLWRW